MKSHCTKFLLDLFIITAITATTATTTTSATFVQPLHSTSTSRIHKEVTPSSPSSSIISQSNALISHRVVRRQSRLHVFIDLSAFVIEHQTFLTSTIFGLGGLFASYLKRTRLAEQAYEDRLLEVQRDRGLPLGQVNNLDYLERIISPEDIYDPYLDDPYAKEDFDPDEEVIKDPFYGDRYYRNGDVFFRINGVFYRQGSLATRNWDYEMFEDKRDDFFYKFEQQFLHNDEEEDEFDEEDERY